MGSYMKSLFQKENMILCAKSKRGITISLLFSIVIVIILMMNIYFSKPITYSFSDDNTCLYPNDVYEYEAINATLEEGFFSPTKDDPRLLFQFDDSISIQSIKIEFQEAISTNLLVEIYYAGLGEKLNEGSVKKTILKKGTETAMISFQKGKYNQLRIDINGNALLKTIEYSSDPLIMNRSFFSFGLPEFISIFIGILCFLFNIGDKTIEFFKGLNYDKINNRKIAVCGYIIVIIIIYFPIISGRMILTPTNLMYAFSPWKSEAVYYEGPLLSDPVDQLIPYFFQTYYGSGYSAWDNSIGIGMPIGLEVLIDPFNWIYFIPIKYAILVESICKYTLAYIGMCMFLRKLNLQWVAVSIGSIGYAFSSAIVMWHFWPHTRVMCLAPLVLFFAKRIIENRKIKDALYFSLLVYLIIVAEMPSFGAYVLYLTGFYILFSTFNKYKKDTKKVLLVFILFGLATIFGIIACFPYLKDLFEKVYNNGYASSRESFASMTLPFTWLHTLILPYDRAGIDWHPNESVIYVGVLIYVLFFFSPIGCKRKKNIFWPIITVILFGFVYSHVFDYIFTKMPAINTSSKTRLISILALSICVSAAINLNDFLQNSKDYIRDFKWLFLFAPIAVGEILLGLCQKESEWIIYSTIGVLFLIFYVICMNLEKGEKTKGIINILLVIISALNMGIFANEYMPFIESNAEVIPQATDSIKYLQENTQDERFISIDSYVLFSNSNEYYDINNFLSHSFINTNEDIKRYRTAIDNNSYESNTNVKCKGINNINLLKYAGVKYIVKEPIYEANVYDSQLVYSADDGLDIYLLSEYAKRFFLSEEIISLSTEEDVLEMMAMEYVPNRVILTKNTSLKGEVAPLTDEDQILVISDEGDNIKLKIHSTSDRILVFNDYNHDRWKALVDNEEKEVLRVNYLFNGISVDSGDHEIELVFYHNDEIRLCYLTIAIIGSIIISIIWITIHNNRKNSKINI